MLPVIVAAAWGMSARRGSTWRVFATSGSSRSSSCAQSSFTDGAQSLRRSSLPQTYQECPCSACSSQAPLAAAAASS